MPVSPAGLDVDGLFVPAPTDRISAQRWVLPTRLSLKMEGGAALWAAPVDWAHHLDFLTAVGVTLLWECLDIFCKDRARVTERREQVRSQGP